MSRRTTRRKKGREIPYSYLFVVVLIAIVLLVVVFNPFTSNTQSKTIMLNPPSSLPDVPFLSGSQSLALHIHVHLDIYVNGSALTIPLTWGYNGYFYAIHTHDTTGIIHIESPVVRNYTLGEIFEVLGYPTFDSRHCLNYSNVPVSVFVNGAQSSNYANITLVAHSEIAVTIGSKSPSSIPSSYQFPSGLLLRPTLVSAGLGDVRRFSQ